MQSPQSLQCQQHQQLHHHTLPSNHQPLQQNQQQYSGQQRLHPQHQIPQAQPPVVTHEHLSHQLQQYQHAFEQHQQLQPTQYQYQHQLQPQQQQRPSTQDLLRSQQQSVMVNQPQTTSMAPPHPATALEITTTLALSQTQLAQASPSTNTSPLSPASELSALPSPIMSPVLSAQSAACISLSTDSADQTNRPSMPPVSKLTDKSKSRRREPSEKSKGTKNHNFTPAQETFYARILSNPELWKQLDGRGDKNAQNESKIDILGNIAKQFNLAFSTEEQVLNLTALQMKNKRRTMQAKWKEADMLFKTAGNGGLSRSTLEDRVKKVCHYYYILRPVWHTSWAMNQREPLQLNNNLTRGASDLADESTDDSEGDDTNSDQGGFTRAPQDGILTNDQQVSTTSTATSAASPMTTAALAAESTGRKRGNFLYTTVLKDLTDAQEKEFELQRRKLDLEEVNQSAQQRIMALQERKLEMDVQAQEEQSKLDSYERETKMKKLKLERMRVDIEIRQAEAEERRLIDLSGETLVLSGWN